MTKQFLVSLDRQRDIGIMIKYRLILDPIMGLLKKASSGVLAIFPCSCSGNTLYAQNWLRAFLPHDSGQDEPFDKLRACFFEPPRGL
jgi:hypothetical protein